MPNKVCGAQAKAGERNPAPVLMMCNKGIQDLMQERAQHNTFRYYHEIGSSISLDPDRIMSVNNYK